MKCSDFIAEYLKEQGIRVVFDYTGGMITNLEDSISRLSGIECLPVRHEQAAGFAAEGYARAGGPFGVAIATSGPGATNMITAIGSCYFDSTPVLYMTGQVNSKDLRRHGRIRQNGFQELDIIAMVKGITKYAKLILDPCDILCELQKAIHAMAEGRPGPVLLDLPYNVQSAEIDPEKLRKYINSEESIKKNYKINGSVRGDEIKKILDKSKSPIVLFGNGIKISKQQAELKKFLFSNNLPSVSSLLGLGELENDFENYLGFIGTYGKRSANIALANADLIFALGTRLDLRQTGNPAHFAVDAKIVHIDIDEYSQKADFNDYNFYNQDLSEFFHEAESLKVTKKEKWLNFIKLAQENFVEDLLSDEYCDPNKFFEYISEIAPEFSIVVGDVGQNQMWLAQSWKIKKGQKLMFSGGMGAMGFSLPTAMGSLSFNSESSVVAFMGDGGFQMNIQELETVKHNKLPLKIFVLNNSSLGMVREFQDQYFNKNYQSTVLGYSCPNVKKIAEAYGIEYLMIKNNESFNLLDNIYCDKNPIIIEIKLNPNSVLRPKVVYGETIENQAPFLNDEKRQLLARLKNEYLN